MELEKQYEHLVNNSIVSRTELRYLLPIKTKEGRLKKRFTPKSNPVDDYQNVHTDVILFDRFPDNVEEVMKYKY